MSRYLAWTARLDCMNEVEHMTARVKRLEETREYQLDQSSPLPATAAADLVLEVQRQKQPQRFADIDRSHHINVRIGHDTLTTAKIGLN